MASAITVDKEMVRTMIAFENANTWYLNSFKKVETFLRNDSQTKVDIMLMRMILKSSMKDGKNGAWDKVVEAIYSNVCKEMLPVVEHLTFLAEILKQCQEKVWMCGDKYRYKPLYKLIDDVLEDMLLDE
jgi:hypothetical protein